MLEIKKTPFEAKEQMYGVKQGQQEGEMVLLKDGQEAYCPFVNPLLIPSPVQGGGVGMMRVPCSSLCSLVSIKKHYKAKSKDSYDKGEDPLEEVKNRIVYHKGCTPSQHHIIQL